MDWDDKRSLKCLERVHSKAMVYSIIWASGGLGKGIQGNRQGQRALHLCTVTSRENLLEDVTWCSTLPTLSTAHKDHFRTENHAQSPLGHCFPVLSVHLFSGVPNSLLSIFIRSFRFNTLPLSSGIVLVSLHTDLDNPPLQLLLPPQLRQLALGPCSVLTHSNLEVVSH